MKTFILFIILLFVVPKSVEAITDCGHCSWKGCDHPTFTQECNRCKEMSAELNNNCHVDQAVKGFGFSGSKNASVLTSKTNIINPFQSTNSYTIKYSYCLHNQNSHDNGCRDDPQTEGAETFDDSHVVSKESDCESNKLSVYGVDYCLIKLDKNDIKNKAPELADFKTDSDDFSDAICARANICWPTTLNCNWRYIGCVSIPLPPGPPPFTPGYLPSTAFIVPTVGRFDELDTTFERPIGVVDLVRGSELLDTIELDIPLSSSISGQDKYKICKKYKDTSTEFCAKINEGDPSQIFITKGSVQLDNYPRPAIEQQQKNKISIFPCYYTYIDVKNNNYQGIYAFAINASKGDTIGTTEDGKTLYIGPNYLPSLSQDTIGDIRETKCDLCINAAKQGDWDKQKIYINGYTGVDNKSQISSCNVNSTISITQIKFDKQDDQPLRFNMFDTDEQNDQDPDTGKPIKNYIYTSESALLQDYLAHVTPVIPVIQGKNQGYEADYDIAVMTPHTNTTCNSYATAANGIMFIKPAGLRNRDYCSKNDTNKNTIGKDDIVTLCDFSDSQDIYKSICPGLYQGVADDSQVLPDKICLMSSDSWDFISGRYKDISIKNLNNDQKIVPRMSCTFLPACTSLGENTVPNIGSAIWDTTASFNGLVKGKCDEKTYSYRYKITEYGFVNQQDAQQYGDDLEQVKKNVANKEYISADDLTINLKALYNQDPNKVVFTCTKIYPESKCIGGIYGNVTDNTSCAVITKDKQPIKCNASN
jgi:hypothetical protein